MLNLIKKLFVKPKPKTASWIDSIYCNGVNVANDAQEDYSIMRQYYGDK